MKSWTNIPPAEVYAHMMLEEEEEESSSSVEED